jgi:hypothetical protein
MNGSEVALYNNFQVPKPTSGFESYVRRHLSKPQSMLDILKITPKLSSLIHELALQIPIYRLVAGPPNSDHGFILYTQAPSTWNHHMQNLLSSLLQLVKLRVDGLWIPRHEASTVDFQNNGDAGRPSWRLPESIKELYVEEALTKDCATEEVIPSIPGLDDSAFYISNNLQAFVGYQDIEKFHYITPFLECDHLVPWLEDFSSLKEFRLDEMWGQIVYRKGMDMVFDALGHLPNLKIIDLRLHCLDTVWPFGNGWGQLVPRVRVVRLYFQWFAEAVCWTTAANNIHFELLIDIDQILRDGETAVKAASEDIEEWEYEERWRNDPMAPGYWERMRLHAVRNAIARVKDVKKSWEERRQQGKQELRDVSIVNCRWSEEGIGPSWFATGCAEVEFDDEMAYLLESAEQE